MRSSSRSHSPARLYYRGVSRSDSVRRRALRRLVVQGGGRRGGGGGFRRRWWRLRRWRRRIPRRWWRARSDDRRTGQGARERRLAEEITVVGNLIGEATVAVAPRAAGRLQDIVGPARRSREPRPAHRQDRGLRDRRTGQAGRSGAGGLARPRSASAKPTCSWRRPTSSARATCSSGSCCPSRRSTTTKRATRPRVAQLDLARAQNTQSKARLDELRINLANTIITSPVNGFVVASAPSIRARSCRRTRRSSMSWTSPRPAGRQRRREGSQGTAGRRRDAGRSRRVSRRDVHGPHRARRRRCSIRRRARRRSRSRFRTRLTG